MATPAVLSGVKVLEFAGLAPVPFCGMVLADYGADVIRIDRAGAGPWNTDTLCRGKRSIAVNLKSKDGVAAVKRMAEKADVILDPFRPGVLEKLGLGPDVLCAANPRLIFARLTGYGQGTSGMALAAGHDINYVSMSGMLSQLGRASPQPPTPPINLLADFAGGGLMCAMGVLLALLERTRSGKGQVIDAAMVEGVHYLSAFIHKNRSGLFSEPRGTNLLDTGAPFYDTYQCSDGGYMAVGSLEPQFYLALLQGLQMSTDEWVPKQMDTSSWPAMREEFRRRFASQPRAHWERVFAQLDACVTPVLRLDELPSSPLMAQRMLGPDEVAPAPRLSRTPARPVLKLPVAGQHSRSVLQEFGFPSDRIAALLSSGAVTEAPPQASL